MLKKTEPEMNRKTKTKLIPLVTPGEMLVEEFLKPFGITEYRFAKDIGIPSRAASMKLCMGVLSGERIQCVTDGVAKAVHPHLFASQFVPFSSGDLELNSFLSFALVDDVFGL